MSRVAIVCGIFSYRPVAEVWQSTGRMILQHKTILLEKQKLHRVPGNVSLPFKPKVNPLTAEWALRALIDFTLSNARRFYSSKGNPLDRKGLMEADCSTVI